MIFGVREAASTIIAPNDDTANRAIVFVANTQAHFLQQVKGYVFHVLSQCESGPGSPRVHTTGCRYQVGHIFTYPVSKHQPDKLMISDQKSAYCAEYTIRMSSVSSQKLRSLFMEAAPLGFLKEPMIVRETNR